MSTNEKNENDVFNSMNPNGVYVRNLSEILDGKNKIQISQLESLLQYCEADYATKRLFKCTQMRDAAVRNPDGTSTRGSHDIEVAGNAGQLAEAYFKSQNNGQELNESQRKQVIIAQIIGLVHDWGHTPMGHDAEVVFTEMLTENPKDQKKFSHDIYSGVVFANLITELKNSPKAQHRKIAEIIEETGLKDYIIQGVQTHSAIYYTDELESNLETDIPLMASRLADTYSFMLTDLVDLSKVDRAKGAQGKILTKDIMTNFIENGTLTQIASVDMEVDEPIPTKQLDTTPFKETLPEDFDYKSIIDIIANGDQYDIGDLRTQMLLEVTEYNNKRADGRIITIPDDIKFLREITSGLQKTIGDRNDWEKGNISKKIARFINTMSEEELNKTVESLMAQGKLDNSISNKEQLISKLQEHPDDFFDFFDEKLVEANKEFNKVCPTVNLIYQMQDEFVYCHLLQNHPEKVLGNDVDKNKALLVNAFNHFKDEFSNLPENEKEDFLKNLYPNFQKYFAFKGKLTKVPAEKAYAIYKTQLLTNEDIEQGRTTPDKSIVDAEKHQFSEKDWEENEQEQTQGQDR